jgi:hypothetical protein
MVHPVAVVEVAVVDVNGTLVAVMEEGASELVIAEVEVKVLKAMD